MKPGEIKKLRKEFGLTQVQFAETMGVTFATVNRWERGHCSPLPDREARLKALNSVSRDIAIGIMPRVPPDQIMGKWSKVLEQELSKTSSQVKNEHPSYVDDTEKRGLWVVQDRDGWQHLMQGKPRKVGDRWVSSVEGLTGLYVPKHQEIYGLKTDKPEPISVIPMPTNH